MISLREIPVFANISDEAIAWFENASERHFVKKGEYIFREGDPVDHMQIILQGKAQFLARQGGNLIPVAVVEEGQIAGVLPFSRLKTATGNGVILEDCTFLALHRDKFQELGETSPELMQNLVGYLSDRVRNFTRTQQQHEKMASLGKLSAGLAHEINNPAAAINRTSEALREKIQLIPTFTARLLDHKLTSTQLQAITNIVSAKCQITTHSELTMMQKSAWEDELVDWMDDHYVDNGFDYAEVLMGANVKAVDLEEMAAEIPSESLNDALAWINTAIEAERLTVEIHQASERISTLVGAIKTYSHMDRAPDAEATNIHEGLDSTLTMLAHKLKGTSININRKYADDLDKIKAHAGELNQVWTNILDNAIDAVGKEGNITIRTFNQDDFVRVDIIDDGPGIPADIQASIFDPFFTTKGVGKGSGLGLDIVMRIIKNHRADIKVKSKSGETIFELCFPKS